MDLGHICVFYYRSVSNDFKLMIMTFYCVAEDDTECPYLYSIEAESRATTIRGKIIVNADDSKPLYSFVTKLLAREIILLLMFN